MDELLYALEECEKTIADLKVKNYDAEIKAEIDAAAEAIRKSYADQHAQEIKDMETERTVIKRVIARIEEKEKADAVVALESTERHYGETQY